MTKNPADNNPHTRTIIALALSDLPQLEHFYHSNVDEMRNAETPFNHSIIETEQILASHIEELSDLVVHSGVPDYPVLLCHLPNVCGSVYLEGEVSWPLVFLDVNRANSREKLREVYIHEAAHLLCEDQDHGISFAVVNNTLRIKSGFAPSKVDYDYRSADWDGLSVSDAKSLSVQIANYAMERGVSATVIAEAMRYVLAVRIPSGIDTTTRSRKILDTFSVYIGGE